MTMELLWRSAYHLSLTISELDEQVSSLSKSCKTKQEKKEKKIPDHWKLHLVYNLSFQTETNINETKRITQWALQITRIFFREIQAYPFLYRTDVKLNHLATVFPLHPLDSIVIRVFSIFPSNSAREQKPNVSHISTCTSLSFQTDRLTQAASRYWTASSKMTAQKRRIYDSYRSLLLLYSLAWLFHFVSN